MTTTLITLVYSIWLARTCIICILAISHKRASRHITHLTNITAAKINKYPLVSIIIPAFNEQSCIQSAIASCLECSYSNLEVIIVDDGSSDGTFAKADAFVKKATAPKLRLFKQPHNSGKAQALNRGLNEAQGSIVVTLDADTRFADPESLRQIIYPLLKDQELSATTACLRVNRQNGLWSSLQDLEYTNVLQFIKQAQCKLNAIMILPGAISAFILKDLRDTGNFSSETLAEDADLTMQLLANGKKLRFIADAVAFTDTPNTFRALFRQRVRWRTGQLQCLVKHKSLLRSNLLQALVYLDTIIANIASLLSPIILFALFLISPNWPGPIAQTIILVLIGFLGVSWGATAICYRFDNRNLPPLPNIVIYITFFSIFNPAITLISIVYLLLSKKPRW